MNQPSSAVVEKKPATPPVVELRGQLLNMEGQFAAALPKHMPVDRFMRVVMTAIQNNGDLLTCNRGSLFNSCMKAAQDGLLPDGREGAIVPYKGQATWMPMIGGLRKKARNSGEIATWDVHAVYAKDAFSFELGDAPFIKHAPTLEDDRGKLIAVYSVAKLKSGEISRDVMSASAVEKIRKLSRAANGPWSNPTFYDEMAKKTVARRHSKVLPTSSDLDDLIRSDDHLYDHDESEKAPARPKLVDFTAPMETEQKEAAEEKKDPAKAKAEEKKSETTVERQPDSEAAEPGAPEAMEMGRQTFRDKRPYRVPEQWADGKDEICASAFKAGYDAEEADAKK